MVYPGDGFSFVSRPFFLWERKNGLGTRLGFAKMKEPEAVSSQACQILHMLSYGGNKRDVQQYYDLISHSGFK